MMNFVILSNASGYGGSERTLEIIAQNLNKEHAVLVYAENEKHFEELKKNNVTVEKTKSGNGLLSILKDLFLMRKMLSQSDCIIGNTNKAGLYISIMHIIFPFIRNKRVILFVRDFQWRFLKAMKMVLGSNVTFCVTTHAGVEYLKSYNINATVIPNPVNLPGHNSNKKAITPPVILCPAMISRWKGISLLIRAVALIKKEFKLIIVGNNVDSEYYAELQTLIEDLKIKDKVEFLNYIHNIGSLYETCSLVVNSSISQHGGPETFGRTIIEGWSYSKPVISFNCGGPAYLIDNEVNGLLIDEGNIEKLALGIDYILSNAEVGTRLGAAGKEKVQDEFTVEVVLKRLFDVIRNK